MRRRFTPSSSRGRRRALRRSQIADLILHGSLTTTEAQAKILKSEIERLISRARKADLITRRWVLVLLPKEEAAEKLFEQIVPQFKDRVGGFVRVVKLPSRKGDSAPMARVEFVEKIVEAAEEKKRGKTQKEEKPATTEAQKKPKRKQEARKQIQRKSA